MISATMIAYWVGLEVLREGRVVTNVTSAEVRAKARTVIPINHSMPAV
jgi:hypothetical protein